jgi:hypothetical protein
MKRKDILGSVKNVAEAVGRGVNSTFGKILLATAGAGIAYSLLTGCAVGSPAPLTTPEPVKTQAPLATPVPVKTQALLPTLVPAPTFMPNKTLCYKGKPERCITVPSGLGKNVVSASEIEEMQGLGMAAVQMNIEGGRCDLKRLAVDSAYTNVQQDALIMDKEVKATLKACEEITGQALYKRLSHNGQMAVLDATAGLIATQESMTFVKYANLPANAVTELRAIQRPVDLSKCSVQDAITRLSTLGYTNPMPLADASTITAAGCSQ